MENVRVHGHEVNGLNEALAIEATDEPGDGGAHHTYLIDLKADENDFSA